MKTLRSIEQIYSAEQFHWVGDAFHVLNFFPQTHALADRLSPFLLLDYAPKSYFEPSLKPRGIGPHPHRGFETVSIAYHGAVSHHDSAGNSGDIFAGDVQWMTAGQGVLHKEYHELQFSKTGGDFQMVQLWVDLPSKLKMRTPQYQTITKDTIPVLNLANQAGTMRIIAGHYDELQGPAHTHTPICLFDLKLKANANVNLHFNAQFNTAFLILDGEVSINEKPASQNQLIVFKNEEGEIKLSTERQAATILVMSGEPLNQAIAQHGPFVMNTVAELQQAINDYHAGKFGELAD